MIANGARSNVFSPLSSGAANTAFCACSSNSATFHAFPPVCISPL